MKPNIIWKPKCRKDIKSWLAYNRWLYSHKLKWLILAPRHEPFSVTEQDLINSWDIDKDES